MTSINLLRPNEESSFTPTNSTNKIVVVGSVYETLEKIKSIMTYGRVVCAGGIAYGCKENVSQLTFRTPFRDSSMGSVVLLTIPTDKISEIELKKYREFQAKALNIIIIDRSVSRIPALLLESIKAIENIRAVVIFEQKVHFVNRNKHLQNIYSFILKPFPFFVYSENNNISMAGIFKKIVKYSNDLCMTQAKLNEAIKNINTTNHEFLRLQELSNVQKELNISFADPKSFSHIFSELHLDCHIQDQISENERKKAIESIKEFYFGSLKKFGDELTKLNEKTTKILGENNSSFNLEDRCWLKATEIESAIYEGTGGSWIEYINRVKNHEVMHGRYDYVNLQQILGKRSREEFNSELEELSPELDTSNSKKTQSTTLNETVENCHRDECKDSFKVALFKVATEIEKKKLELKAKINRMLGESNVGLSLEQRCELRAQVVEARLFAASYGNLLDYVSLIRQEFNHNGVEVNVKVACPSKPIDIIGVAGLFPKEWGALKYEIRYNAPYSRELTGFSEYMTIRNLQGKEVQNIPSTVRVAPEELMNKWKNGESKVEVSLPGYSREMTVDIKNSKLMFPNGYTVDGLQKFIKFNNQEILYPSYWEGFQETPLDVFPLKSDSEVYKLYEQEVKKINPNAILESVKQIQDIQSLNTFELKWCEIEQTLEKYPTLMRDLTKSKAKVEKNIDPIAVELGNGDKLYTEPVCLYFSAMETSPDGIIERDGVPMDSVKLDPNRHWGTNSIQLSESILHADRTSFTTHKDGESFVTKQIFVFETLLGVSAKYDDYCPDLKRPPEIGSINSLSYHYSSIRGMDHELNVEVHNVYDRSQLVPRYLIRYTVPIKDPNPADSK